MLDQPVQRHIDEIKENSKNKYGDDHHDGCVPDLFQRRPGNFSNFGIDLYEKRFDAIPEIFRFTEALLQFIRHNQFSCRLHNMTWQARRDSNPHHPVLETGALAVGATGLFSFYFTSL
jgi:hypothetical protein